MFFMVEVKTTRDSRQHRLHKIVTTLERELHFDVFRFKYKTFFPEWASAQGSRLVGGPLGLPPTQLRHSVGDQIVEKYIVFRFLRSKKHEKSR